LVDALRYDGRDVIQSIETFYMSTVHSTGRHIEMSPAEIFQSAATKYANGKPELVEYWL
jgi:hypothetical protein